MLLLSVVIRSGRGAARYLPSAVALVLLAGLASGAVTQLHAATIGAGYSHTCALIGNGRVECWGANFSGQLGDGTLESRQAPVYVKDLSGVTAIAVGSAHTCALIGTGRVKCWGGNFAGQLGDGTVVSQSTPVFVKDLNGVTAIAASGAHTCARIGGIGGEIKCWGPSWQAQPGDKTATDPKTPTLKTSLSGVSTGVAAGGAHSCAVDASRVQCWGNNAFGQLGDGTTTDRPNPTFVKQITGAVAVAAGGAHTCAIVGTGRVECWGDNDRGQLGDASTTNRTSPVYVKNVVGVLIPD
jgi:alpha-tubulin suppressor-like RCC1 family protein